MQLLGPDEGRRAPSSEASFVSLQARQAIQAGEQRCLRVLQWRAPETDPERIASASYRELVMGRFAQAI